MSGKPILFSTPMVQALLDGRKTQTRRLLKPQPVSQVTGAGRFGSTQANGFWKDEWSWLSGHQTDIDTVQFEGDFKTNYLEGDLLYVRETWGTTKAYDAWPPRRLHRNYSVGYKTDDIGKWCQTGCNGAAGKWRPGIHMPRWVSRITLEVTDVRVQKIQDISDEDAEAEGPPECPAGCTLGWLREGPNDVECTEPNCGEPYKDTFQRLWDSLNKKRGFGWDVNPWVAAISFEVHKQNIDELLKERAA